MKTDIFKGKVEVRLGVVYKDNWYRPGGLPFITLTMGNSDEFAKKVFTFLSGNYFDQPAAARTLVGTINTFNMLALKEAGSIYIDNTKTGVNYFINCNDEEVEIALKTKLQSD